MTGSSYWTCDSCGKLTDGRPGMDDSFDCFCERCWDCKELAHECLCDPPYYEDEGDE